MNLIHHDGRFFAYSLPGDRIAVVEHRAIARPRGTPQEKLDPCTELVKFVRDLLLQTNRLYRLGSQAVLITRTGPYAYDSIPGMLTTLTEEISFGFRHGDMPVELSFATREAADLEDPHAIWDSVCRGSEIAPLRVMGQGMKLWTALVDVRNVPEYGGELSHPIVGELPPGWFAPAAPATVTDFPHLRALYEHYPLDQASRLRLYAYLLACFQARSLVVPAPLLVADSWVQGVGKTEILASLGILLDGETSNLTPPRGGDTDELVAHFLRGRRLAAMDNLTGARSWNHPWIASILTDRNTSARAKYSRKATNFRGRLAAVSFVFGTATLHKDLLTRAWRVQLWGEAKPIDRQAQLYAEQHKAAIRAECYSLVATTPQDGFFRLTPTRAAEFEALGMPAACRLLGVEGPPQAREILKNSQKLVDSLGSDMLNLVMMRSVPLYDEPCLQTSRPLPRTIQDTLIGCVALGKQVVPGEDGPQFKEVTFE